MSDIRCFMVEPAPRQRRMLRVDTQRPCDQPRYSGAKCSARIDYDVVDEPYAPDADGVDRPSPEADAGDRAMRTDSSVPWPDRCETCGHVFDEMGDSVFRVVDRWRFWRNVETGEEYGRLTPSEVPAGAMWRSKWLRSFCASQDDGDPLSVMTPGGQWEVDGQSSNCTQQEDRHQDHHHCWVRHGTPPTITVDKNGATCAAGAGSIQCGHYHGFLRNGHLTDA